MQKSAGITVVPVDVLDSTPAAFQEYVRKHFVEQDIFGRKCFVAFGASSKPSWDNVNDKKGGAPSHSADLMHYTDGLEGISLYEWIQQAAKQGIIWKFHAYWNDGMRGISS